MMTGTKPKYSPPERDADDWRADKQKCQLQATRCEEHGDVMWP